MRENERAEWSGNKSQLQATARRVDRLNKRWYGAWGNNFAVGSPEHNAMPSQVDTEEGTNPPTAKEIATVTQSGLTVAVAYIAGGGNHATSLMLQWQVVGVDADFGHDTPVILTGQTINFRTAASNSTVTTSIKSAVKTETLT